MNRVSFFCVLMGLMCGYVQAAELEPVEIEASIQHSGAKSTITDLIRREQWETVTDMIDTGDSAWIALVPKLARGADELATDELAISLAYALPKNAPSVLNALSLEHVVSIERVCSMPFADDIIKDRPAYKRMAMRALDQVKDSDVSRTKLDCLDFLKRAQ